VFHTPTPTPKTPIFEGVNQKSVDVGVGVNGYQHQHLHLEFWCRYVCK